MKNFTKGTNTAVFAWHVYYGLQWWKKLEQHFFCPLYVCWSINSVFFCSVAFYSYVILKGALYKTFFWPTIHIKSILVQFPEFQMSREGRNLLFIIKLHNLFWSNNADDSFMSLKNPWSSCQLNFMGVFD